MLEYYLNQCKAGIKYLNGFLTICFKLFIAISIFVAGIYYANSDKVCSIEIHKPHETIVYSGIKSSL